MLSGTGVPVTVDFSGKSSAAKRRWLEETAVPVRRLVFHREGYSGALMLDDSCRVCFWQPGSGVIFVPNHTVQHPSRAGHMATIYMRTEVVV